MILILRGLGREEIQVGGRPVTPKRLQNAPSAQHQAMLRDAPSQQWRNFVKGILYVGRQ